jgi:hypothetical protein
MAFEYNSLVELYAHISSITKKYYLSLTANIFYIEELTQKNQVALMVALRDANAHLSLILSCDNPLGLDVKEYMMEHLQKYSSHLERAFLDSFIKIAEIKFGYLLSVIPIRERNTIRLQVALKIRDLRVMTLTNENKISGYVELIGFIDSIRNKFTHHKT